MGVSNCHMNVLPHLNVLQGTALLAAPFVAVLLIFNSMGAICHLKLSVLLGWRQISLGGTLPTE